MQQNTDWQLKTLTLSETNYVQLTHLLFIGYQCHTQQPGTHYVSILRTKFTMLSETFYAILDQK